jgi:hypothetical protein
LAHDQVSSSDEVAVRMASSSASELTITAAGGNVQPRIALAFGLTAPESAPSVTIQVAVPVLVRA